MPLDFEFPFYGRVFTHSWMFSNGVIGFLEPTSSFCCTGYDISNQNYGNSVSFTLMPLQTDLRNYNGQFLTKGDENSMTYGWYNISEYGRPGSSNTFEAEIFADGMYQFRYGDLDVARDVTIASIGDRSLEDYTVYHHGILPNNGIETITSYGLGGMCQVDPLYDPNCPGYAEAYAQQQYQQNCFANPLYDAGCPGYAEAFFESQCIADPLYDQSCPGHEQAFFDLQCDQNPLNDQECSGYSNAFFDLQCEQSSLYDQSCPGYASAFYDLQCEMNPLYDSGCPGYAQTFFLEQCSLDPLYDSTCDGYSDAFLEQQCDRDPTYSASCEGYSNTLAEQNKQSDSTTSALASVESLTEPSLTGDTLVDSVIRESSESMQTVQLIVVPVPTLESDLESEPEPNQTEEQSEEEVDPQESRRKKLRDITEQEARGLAEDMSRAASLEQQQAVQARVMSMISYVPGFSAYAQRGIPQPTSYYVTEEIYQNMDVPDSNSGARVGLAQEILHNRMVDMQYGD